MVILVTLIKYKEAKLLYPVADAVANTSLMVDMRLFSLLSHSAIYFHIQL